MNIGLIIFGVILIGGMFFLANIYITAQQKQQIKLVETVCSFNLWGIPVGQIGQALSPEAAEKCEQVKFAKQILSFQPFAYIAGAIFIVLGLIIGGKKEIQVIREVVRPHKKEEEYEEEYEDIEKGEKGKYKFCSRCGNPVNPKEKFCGKCGNKL